ncbi:MAG: heavy-metal-associated domain-containing protein [Gemmatimonadetes bacterium]|nr:heavy-metal-associated domain-containing protein [Gemmatimonadota bacterium]
MTALTLNISGMSCGHCVGAVKQALAAVPGVQVDAVAIGTAVVQYDPATVTAERIAQAVADEGYPAVVAG